MKATTNAAERDRPPAQWTRTPPFSIPASTKMLTAPMAVRMLELSLLSAAVYRASGQEQVLRVGGAKGFCSTSRRSRMLRHGGANKDGELLPVCVGVQTTAWQTNVCPNLAC